MGRSAAKAELTPRQKRALEVLQRWQRRHGAPPTRAELGEALGVSAQTADFHLRALEKKGYVQITGQARGVRFAPAAADDLERHTEPVRTIPLLGRVAAGGPTLAIENLEGRIPLPDGCGADFALRVQGDSMIEAGIFDGDLALVKQSRTADKGEIVVALVGEGEMVEATVKRYLPGRNRIVLRPANASLSDIVVRPEEGFALVGRVVGVLRLWS